MAPRFRPGSSAYARDGRRYIVDDVEDGIVYCRSENGAETEFAEAQLTSETEWAARAGNRTDRLYAAIRQSTNYAPYKGKLNPAAAERLLVKAERLVPGLLDFVAFVAAERILAEAGHGATGAELSPRKCREIFENAVPQTRAVILAWLIGSPPEVLVGAADLGDNLLRAMLEKATLSGSVPFETFHARRGR